VGSGFLHVSQGHASVQGGGDECMPQRMRPDVLGDPRPLGYPADDPPGAVPVQPPPVRRKEDRSLASIADSQIDRPRSARRQRDRDDLAALTGNDQGPVPAFQAQGLDIGAGGLGDAQPVEGEQGDQRMLAGRPEPSGDQQTAELDAVLAGGVRLIIQPGMADMGGRGVLEQFLLYGVPIEPGDRAQPAGDRGPGPAAGFQVPGGALDVRVPSLEQVQAMLAAPAGELA
jgi:hypothetical protein